MTNTEEDMSLSRLVAQYVRERAARRAEATEGDWRDWNDHDAFLQFVSVLYSVHVLATEPRRVMACVDMPGGARSHSYVASEALDIDVEDLALNARVALPAGFDPVITDLDYGVWELTW